VNGVWMVIPSFHPLIGGAEVQARRMSAALMGRGWDVRILTRQSTDRFGTRCSKQEHVDGIPVTRVGSGGDTKLASLQYLLGGLRILAVNGGGAIYHAHDLGTPGLLAALARRWFGGRSVVKLRTGAAAYRARLANPVSRWLFVRLLRLHDRIIVVNSEVEALLGVLGFPEGRVVRIPNGIDTETSRGSSREEMREARIALNLPLDTVLVLSVGRLAHVKGVDVLLSAWAMLPEETRRACKLVIVGDGPARSELTNLAHSLGIQGDVCFAGASSNVQDYYCAADVFVLPSRTEGLSNALLEAMASELPVVTTAVGGAKDVVQDHVSGFLVSPEDAGDLARGLRLLLSEPAYWGTMGAQARNRVIEYADIDVIVEQLERVYMSLCLDCSAFPFDRTVRREAHQEVDIV
jgi:glycosyltransferase involved in cell wall biosynthesis